jgi:hypothetical protein
MTKRTHHRAADKALCLRVMQLELGKQLTSMFKVPSESSPELHSLLRRIVQADQTPQGSQ